MSEEITRVFVVEDQPALLKNLLKVLATFPELSVVGSSASFDSAGRSCAASTLPSWTPN